MSSDASIVVMGVLGLPGKVKVLNTQVNVDTVRYFGREEVSVHLRNNEIQDVDFVCDDGEVLAHRVILGDFSLLIGYSTP